MIFIDSILVFLTASLVFEALCEPKIQLSYFLRGDKSSNGSCAKTSKATELTILVSIALTRDFFYFSYVWLQRLNIIIDLT